MLAQMRKPFSQRVSDAREQAREVLRCVLGAMHTDALTRTKFTRTISIVANNGILHVDDEMSDLPTRQAGNGWDHAIEFLTEAIDKPCTFEKRWAVFCCDNGEMTATVCRYRSLRAKDE